MQDEEQEAQEAPPLRDPVREQLARRIRRDGWLADDRYPEAGRGEGVGHRMQRALQAAELCRDYPLDAWLDGRWSSMVSDPPPQELSRDGRTYYLAHFNAYRAYYSAETPSAEQAATR